MIVVDLGCAEIGEEESVNRLIKRFHPKVLFGFDPSIEGGVETRNNYHQTLPSTCIIRSPLAAWTHDGWCAFLTDTDPTKRRVIPSSQLAPRTSRVRCFDINNFLNLLPKKEPVVLKMDVEGAEYTLLPHMYEGLINRWPWKILVEWHGEPLDTPYLVEEWT